jgi:hypothetical protein
MNKIAKEKLKLPGRSQKKKKTYVYENKYKNVLQIQ